MQERWKQHDLLPAKKHACWPTLLCIQVGGGGGGREVPWPSIRRSKANVVCFSLLSPHIAHPHRSDTHTLHSKIYRTIQWPFSISGEIHGSALELLSLEETQVARVPHPHLPPLHTHFSWLTRSLFRCYSGFDYACYSCQVTQDAKKNLNWKRSLLVVGPSFRFLYSSPNSLITLAPSSHTHTTLCPFHDFFFFNELAINKNGNS